jgi:hypothetical protein
MFSQSYAPLGYQQITSLAASTALTVPPGANVALIDCEAQAVRWRSVGGTMARLPRRQSA